MKILVTNVYSYKNKGDAAIVIALLSEIKRVFKNSNTIVQTTDIQNDKDKYGVPITPSLLWLLLSSLHSYSPLKLITIFSFRTFSLTLYITVKKLFHVPLKFVLSKSMRQFVNDIESSDLVVACGGGYLRTASSKPRDCLLLFVTCLNFVAPVYLGKKVYLYSQSIGPVYGGLQKWILKFSLNKVLLIESRENLSTKYLKGLLLRTQVVETADPVFLLGGKKMKSGLSLANNRLKVGITVRKWFDNDAQMEKYVKAMASTINYLIEAHNAHLYYLPQVIADNFGDDDRLVAEKVYDLVDNKEEFTLLSIDMHPFQIIEFCSKLDFFIGTRMHSNIYALVNEVPVIAIEYEPKTRGIMKGLELENYVIKIEDINNENLKKLFDILSAERSDYVKRLHTALHKNIKKSSSAIELIKQCYLST